jgi:hypothetical protein
VLACVCMSVWVCVYVCVCVCLCVSGRESSVFGVCLALLSYFGHAA